MCRLRNNSVASSVCASLVHHHHRGLHLKATHKTALLAAVWRDLEQRESRRPLLSDPQAPILADAFLSAEERAAFELHPLRQEGVDILAARTRLIDHWLDSAYYPPVHTTRRQTVLLGAGMDTRPYRLGLSRETTVFEVEVDGEVLRAKHSVLASAGFRPRCHVQSVAADLSDAAQVSRALEDAGFDRRLPTRWVAEGVLEHLPPSKHRALFEMTARLSGCPGSGCAMQVLEPSWGLAWGQHAAASRPATLPYAPLRALEATIEDVRQAGWRNVRALRASEIAAACGRHTHEGFSLLFADADELA